MKQCGRRVVGGVMSTRTLAERGGRRPDRPAHGLAVSGPEIFVQASISETSDSGLSLAESRPSASRVGKARPRLETVRPLRGIFCASNRLPLSEDIGAGQSAALRDREVLAMDRLCAVAVALATLVAGYAEARGLGGGSREPGMSS